MRLRLPVSFLRSPLLNFLLGNHPSYITTPNGIIVFTDPLVTGDSNVVKLQVVADNIIRVIVARGKEMAPAQSLFTGYGKSPDFSWHVFSSKKSLTLQTKNLTAIVDLKTGAVSFRDRKGNTGPDEKQPSGRNFLPAIFKRKRFCNLSRTFQTKAGDAGYERRYFFSATPSFIPFTLYKTQLFLIN